MKIKTAIFNRKMSDNMNVKKLWILSLSFLVSALIPRIAYTSTDRLGRPLSGEPSNLEIRSEIMNRGKINGIAGRQFAQLVNSSDDGSESSENNFISARERFGRRIKSHRDNDNRDENSKRTSLSARRAQREKERAERLKNRGERPTPARERRPLQLRTPPSEASSNVPTVTASSLTTSDDSTVPSNDIKAIVQEDGKIHLDFRDTDLRTIINFLSEQTKTNYLYDDTLKGKVTLVGPQKVPLEEAVWLLESLLEYKGYTVVKVGDFKKIIPLAKAQGDHIETRLAYENSQEPDLSQNKEVTQLIHLKYTNAADIKAAIAGLLAKPNSIITYAHTNTLIVTENALNIKRIVSIINELDVPVYGKNVHLVPLRYTQAAGLSKELEALLKQQVEEKVNPETRQEKISAPSVLAEERTNSIILICLDRDYKRIRELISNLDQDITSLPTMKVMEVKFAEAETIASTIKEMLKAGGEKTASAITIAADKRTNSIIISSMSAHLIQRAMDIVGQLDKDIVPEQKTIVKVYHLEFAEAEKVAELLSGFSFVPVEELRDQKAVDKTAKQSKETDTVSIVPDPATNSLIVTTPKHRWPHILKVIEKLDLVRPQVMVEVLVAEVDISKAKELGIDFNAVDAEGDGNRPFALANADNLESFLSSSGVANGLSLGIITGGAFDFGAAASGDVGELSKIGLLIRAMANDTNTNILSAPTIMTSDNEPARISVGEQIQLPSSFNTAANTGLNTITNYATEDLGVILELTPRITKDDHVLLKINQTIKARTSDTLYDQNVPVISKREVDTSITVLDNTTIALGGIISEEETHSQTKIPILSDIPGLGKLFRNKRSSIKKVNLMIFLTPHIIRCQADADRIARMQRDSIKGSLVNKRGTSKSLSVNLDALDIPAESGVKEHTSIPEPVRIIAPQSDQAHVTKKDPEPTTSKTASSEIKPDAPKSLHMRARELFDRYKKDHI